MINTEYEPTKACLNCIIIRHTPSQGKISEPPLNEVCSNSERDSHHHPLPLYFTSILLLDLKYKRARNRSPSIEVDYSLDLIKLSFSQIEFIK